MRKERQRNANQHFPHGAEKKLSHFLHGPRRSSAASDNTIRAHLDAPAGAMQRRCGDDEGVGRRCQSAERTCESDSHETSSWTIFIGTNRFDSYRFYGFAAESGQIRENRTFSARVNQATPASLRYPPSVFNKNSTLKPSRFEPLYQPYFGFWLFTWSRCGRIVKKSRRKDSWYQDYSVLLTSPSPSCHQMPSPFVPETAPNI